MIIITIIHLISWFLAAACKAGMDTLQFHYHDSVFKRSRIEFDYFWNPVLSWRSKYYNRDPAEGPLFWGSTTFFVFLTDGWHLLQAGMNFSITVAMVTSIYLGAPYELKWWNYIVFFIIYRILWGSTFEWFYSRLLKRKNILS